MVTRTLGSLTAADLGSTITVTDGGSSHTGQLRGADHALTGADTPRTCIVLRAGQWSHVKSYPSDTEATVKPEPTPLNPTSSPTSSPPLPKQVPR